MDQNVLSSYAYTPYIWPTVIAIGFTMAVGIYSWRHRSVPGATGLAFMMFFWSFKLLATILGLVAEELPAKAFWFQIERFCLLPATGASLVFALEYAGLDKWLNRRNLTLMAIPAILLIPLTLTNEAHHLIWTDMWLDGRIRYHAGVLAYPLWGYGLLLGTATLSILIWLFIRSPLHRWPVGLILFNMAAGRTVFYFTETGLNPLQSIDLFDLAAIFICPVYFVALFHFRMFDVVPVARNRLIEQMRDGMLVLDAQTRIVDLNKTAQKLIGAPRSKIIGRRADEIFLAHPELLEVICRPASAQDNVWPGEGGCYRVHISPLTNQRGFNLGRLILFYDISEEKRTQEQLEEHQRKLAGLEEREWLARELHDGVGQVLAAVHLQVKIAGELLARGETGGAKTSIDQLADVIREGKAYVGDYLFGVKTWSSKDQFFTCLRQYLVNYSQNGGVRTELVIPSEIEGNPPGEAIETQLQRIIQEALTNIRKHANARSARITFALDEGEVRITIEDDGQGFDPTQLSNDHNFGLRSMRGRAEAVGGRVEVNSKPGSGTRVSIRVPWRKSQ